MTGTQIYSKDHFEELADAKAMIEVEAQVGTELKTFIGKVHHPEFRTVWVGSQVFHYKQIRKFKEL